MMTAPPPLTRFIASVLAYLPSSWKVHFYDAVVPLSRRFYGEISPFVYRLPFGLALKIITNLDANEAVAYTYVRSLQGIRIPYLVDSIVFAGDLYLVTGWVNGPTVEDVFDQLTQDDRDRIAKDLNRQIHSLRLQAMQFKPQRVSNLSGGPIEDPRLPWGNPPRTYATTQEFGVEVWPGLNRACIRDTLKPQIIPLINRDVPVVFTHGDLLPKNIIIPVSLDHWRLTSEPLCIIDWQYAGWMPYYWDALKATWLEFEPDTDWMRVVRDVFPECRAELDADWRWRSESGVTIV